MEKNTNRIDYLNDPLLSDDTGIFEVRDELKSRVRPDYIAARKKCRDFDCFDQLFEQVRKSIADGLCKPLPIRHGRVKVGEFFVLKGQLVHVADVFDKHARNGKPDARLRAIFDNGTECNLLMSSLVRRLYEDKRAQRIGKLDADP